MGIRPVIIVDENQLVGLLRGRRLKLGLSQGQVDHLVGWPDAYCPKVEAPDRRYGRRVVWGLATALNALLQRAGLALVLMERTEADAHLAGASPVKAVPSSAVVECADSRAGRSIVSRTVTTRIRFTRAA